MTTHTPGPRVDLPGQMELPYTAPRPTDLAKRHAAAPLKPTKPQQPCDVGLFSDEASQLEMFQ